MIGPGKWIDTQKYYVICSNVLGGCSGTTGPSSVDPRTGKPYGLHFPMVTIADMVHVQKHLLEYLGISRLLAVIGGSLGGMQVLQWMIDYPDWVQAAVPIATTAHLGPQSIAFDAVGRHAILADTDFKNGQYHDSHGPDQGLAIARMIGHITYLSENSMRQKFGRQLRHARDYSFDLNPEFAVETYLDYKGQTFVDRFDANSYLYITKAADYFDVEKEYGTLEKAFASVASRVLAVSFSSDWLFTPEQLKAIVNALAVNNKDISYCNIDSSYGHDAFLLETESLGTLIGCFLEATYRPGCAPTNSICASRHKPALSEFAQAQRSRVDYKLIEALIEPGNRILDIGCSDGELLDRLRQEKQADVQGIELDQEMILNCICRGLPIIQYDAEESLGGYADNSFDYVILSQTIQTVQHPETLLTELYRIGKQVIVSFPNFAFWGCRLQLALKGKAPVTKQLPFTWYNSPNIHFLSLKDFECFCKDRGILIEKRIPLTKTRMVPVRFLPNLFAEQAIYVTRKT
jgi:homoserine O-acetyltransferase